MPYIIMAPQMQRDLGALQLDATVISYLRHVFLLYVDLTTELSGFIIILMLLQHTPACTLEASS